MVKIIALMVSFGLALQQVIQKVKSMARKAKVNDYRNNSQRVLDLNFPRLQGASPKPANEAERLDAVTGLNQANSEHQPELVALRNTGK